jgi:hypothetical protein
MEEKRNMYRLLVGKPKGTGPGNCRVAAQLVASRVVLSSTELVS